MLNTVEGIYKDGKIQLSELPAGVEEADVMVTFIPRSRKRGKMMTFGMFADTGRPMSTEEDFKIAEWRGEPEFDDVL